MSYLFQIISLQQAGKKQRVKAERELAKPKKPVYNPINPTNGNKEG